METNTNYSTKIKILNSNIKELEESLKNNGALNPEIQKAERRKRYLETVKNTIQAFSKTGHLFSGKITDAAEPVQMRKEKFFYEEENEEQKKITPVEVGLMIIYGILAVLMFVPWAELGGYEVDMGSMFSSAGLLERMGAGSESGLYFFIIIACFALLGCAVMYGIQIYNTFRRVYTNLPYMSMLTVIIIWLVFWLCTVSWNSSFDGAMGYTFLSAELKGGAWFSLLLAVAAAVIYNKSDEINERLFGVEEEQEEITVSLPVTNYYPWEDICFTSVTLNKKDAVSFAVQYRKSKLIKYRKNTAGGSIPSEAEFITDIFFKTPGKEYVITNCPLSVKYNVSVGETEQIVLERTPFAINEVNDIKIVLKERRTANGEKTTLHSISLDSGMNSVELESYRKQNRWKDAFCREQKLGNGWICRCGLVHGEYEESCVNCGSGRI